MSTYKFKKNESFYIRDGWFEKAINSINEAKIKNIFSKNEGVKILGIGSNMVKGLRYWLATSNVIHTNATTTELTEFGQLLLKHDQYLETTFSWSLIHYFLVKNKYECPIFNLIFNGGQKYFTKKDKINDLIAFFKENGVTPKIDYVEDDLNVFLKSYINEEIIDNPEDNYSCPLSTLKLISKKKDRYEKCKPSYNTISYFVVYFILCDLYGNTAFNIEDSLDVDNSPAKVFNLDKNTYLQYLDEMKNNGLITINKTAGLNTVYFTKQLDITDVFNLYFGG